MVHLRSGSLLFVLGVALSGCGQAAPGDLPPGAVRGTLRMRIATFDDHAETFYRLETKDETISLSFDKPPHAAPGSEVVVRGVREPGRIRVTDLDVKTIEPHEKTLELAADKKALKIALVIVDTSYTVARGKQRLLTAPDSPAAFYKENSYGDWSIDGDAFGPYTIDIPSCNDSELDPIAARATAAAQADGHDMSQYDNLMVYMPASAGCTWGGIAEVGINAAIGFKNGKNTWYRGDGCVVFAQELGHNFGLLHSHTCTSSPYASADYGGAACAGFSEYGDKLTPMGGGCGHFNAPEMGHMGFISGCNTVAVAANGTFEIGPIETRCSGPQVLRVAGATSVNQGPQYVYADYRKGMGTIGSDTRSPAGIYLHASAQYGGNLTNTQDPDNRYAVDPFSLHAPLTAGQSWTEPTSGVTFNVMALGDTATVQLTFASAGGAGPKCIDGSTPPASPMCNAVVDGGTGAGGSGGSGGAKPDGGSTGGSGGAAGATATGGNAGSAGATGEGGAGAGGAGAGAGGSGGSGGSSAGTPGASGSATTGPTTGPSTTGGTTPSGNDSGCGCRAAGSRHRTMSSAWLLGLVASMAILRRSRRTFRTLRLGPHAEGSRNFRKASHRLPPTGCEDPST